MPNWVRRFVDIRPREVEPTFLFFSFWFIVILVFQILRPLKKGLFVDALGAKTELYAKLANIGVAILLMVIFTALYNRLGTRRMITVLCAAFVLSLAGFSMAFAGDKPGELLTWSFYLFGDGWSTLWVTTFWAYLNELTQTDQAKRLYGIIGAGGVIGGLVGPLAVWQLVRPLGAPVLLAGSAVATAIIGVLIWRTERIASRPDSSIGRREKAAAQPAKAANPAIEGGKLVARSRYLLAITAIVFLYEVVSQILDYQYSSAAETLQGAGVTQAFFGQVGTIVGVVSVITQLFLVSFVIRSFGLTTALLVLPVAMGLASGVYVAVPLLWTAALLTISDNSFSYSMNQTARETLFVPTPSDVKYKARAFSNMFVQRLGKGFAILMALGLSAFPIRILSLVALVVIAVWAYLAAYAGRRFESMTKEGEPARVEPPPAPALLKSPAT
jgi:AAA family ATP:ADP antiporter